MKHNIIHLSTNDVVKMITEISSKFIQDRIANTYQRNKDGYGQIGWRWEDNLPKDERVRSMRHLAADAWFDEHGNYRKNYNDQSIDGAEDKYRDVEAFYLDPDYNTIDDLIRGLKAGELLVHCRRMIGRETQDYIYPEVGETVMKCYGCEIDAEDLEPLVFASDNFSWTGIDTTRNGIYFVKSDTFVRYIGDGAVQYPNGRIEMWYDTPVTVESGDWFSYDRVEVVAILRQKRDFRRKQ